MVRIIALVANQDNLQYPRTSRGLTAKEYFSWKESHEETRIRSYVALMSDGQVKSW